MDKTEKTLEYVIDGLIKSVTDEANARIPNGAIEDIKDSYMTRTPEAYSVCFNFPIEETLNSLTKLIIPDFDKYEKKVRETICYLWRNFSEVEHYISEFIAKFEGSGCSVDKGRWLLNRYIDFLVNEEYPDMTITEKCYWKPHFGSAEDWMKWIELYLKNHYRPELEFFSLTTKLLKEGNTYKIMRMYELRN